LPEIPLPANLIAMTATFAIHTLGCKVNQYESQQTRQLLEQFGFTQVNIAEKPGLVLINTCCVTHTASAKSRQSIRKAQRLNPNAPVIVIGCLPTADTGELKPLGPNVHLISHQDDLPDRLADILNKASFDFVEQSRTNKTELAPNIKHKKNLVNQTNLAPLKSFAGQSRAFLKIQDGCDGYCSYCIIPKIRRNVFSKPMDVVLAEAQDLVAAGHKEIVLTGIFLGAYGQDTVRRSKWDPARKDKLAELLNNISQVPGLARVRLSSLEPSDLTEKLLEVMENNRNIVPHLHLPLQSGSERILKKMARQYTVADFRKAIDQLKLRLDRPAITTDIIVGFPGETEQDFQQTLELAEEIGFAKMHVFPFSRRKGTTAAEMQEQVPTDVIKRRSRILRRLDSRLQQEFRRQFVGETVEVIVEDTNPPRGRTGRYFMVELAGSERVGKGQLVCGVWAK